MTGPIVIESTLIPEEWVDEDSDSIFVSIIRMKSDGRSQGQMITLDEFKKMLVGE